MITFENFKFWKNGSPVNYSGVVLDEKSRNLLISKFIKDNPKFDNWKILADHMTICLHALPHHIRQYWLDEEVSLTVREIGESDHVLAVKVTGFFVISKTSDLEGDGPKFQHITLSVSPDGKPSMSNEITNWVKVKSFRINGVIKQVNQNGG